MNFTELINTLKSEGFDYCATSQLEDWVQRSYQQLSARYQWPWLEKMREATTPFGMEDLRYILSVNDNTQKVPLWGQDRRWLVERFPNDPNLEEEGNPVWWFLVNEIIRIYPNAKANQIDVRYVKKPEKLTALTEPTIPNEWQYLIIDQARVYALKNNDEFQIANELKASVKEDLNEMIADQLHRDWQSSRQIVRSGWPTEYL